MNQRIQVAAVCLLVTSLSGCAVFGSKTVSDPEAEQAGDPEWLQDLKALGGTGATTGVSSQAREIEKSLGAW